MKTCPACDGKGSALEIGYLQENYLVHCRECMGTGRVPDELAPIVTCGEQPFPLATD